jgi:hypothetical protein
MSDERPSVISRIADSKPPKSYQSKLGGGVALLIGLAVWYAVGRFKSAVVAEAAAYSTMVVVFTGWMSWSGLSRRWFWIFMAAVVSIHGVVLRTAPWPSHYETSKRDIVFLVGDLILMLALGELVARLTGKPSGKPGAQ